MKRKTVPLPILLSLVHIYCQDAEDAVELKYNMGREHINALSEVPSFLEYLIGVMQKRLAISEKDDISVAEDDIVESSHHTEQDSNEERTKKHVKARDIFYVRIAPVSRVTPDDVMRQILKVQKKLEDYNAQRKGKNII